MDPEPNIPSVKVEDACEKPQPPSTPIQLPESDYVLPRQDSPLPPPLPKTIPPPPKPAVWQDKEPTDPWLPEFLAPHFPWPGHVYEDYQERFYSNTFGGPLANWQVYAGSRRGKMHAHKGTHREDAFDYVLTDHYAILSVSDGAGSCALSRIGSQITCNLISQLLTKGFEERKEILYGLAAEDLQREIGSAICEAVYKTCDFLRDLAGKTEGKAQAKDFRCTLLLAVHYVGSQAETLLFSQVGDGFCAIQRQDGTSERVGKSDSGAFSGEVTCFIPDKDAPNRAAHLKRINPAQLGTLILCSDGIEDPFYPVERNLSGIFRQLNLGVQENLPGFDTQPIYGPVIENPNHSEHLLKWLSFEKRGENDDRTILIYHRKK